MYLFPVLAFALIVIFLIILIGRQSASIPRSTESQKRIGPDANSDLSLVSTDPSQDIQHTLLNSVHDAAYQNVPVGNFATESVVDSVGCVDYISGGDSTGGQLGDTLANALDGGGSSFSTFDSGNDFGTSSPSDGTSS